MKTIALRFSDSFAPSCGTIDAHREIISRKDSVLFGKKGCKVSDVIIREILSSVSPRILLLRNGTHERYWAYVKNILHDPFDKSYIPNYYKNNSRECLTWFEITKFELAKDDVLKNCVILSSGKTLDEMFNKAIASYFVINYNGN